VGSTVHPGRFRLRCFGKQNEVHESTKLSAGTKEFSMAGSVDGTMSSSRCTETGGSGGRGSRRSGQRVKRRGLHQPKRPQRRARDDTFLALSKAVALVSLIRFKVPRRQRFLRMEGTTGSGQTEAGLMVSSSGYVRCWLAGPRLEGRAPTRHSWRVPFR
jgi:hypothetical protein